MISVKSPEDIAKMERGGKVLARILRDMREYTKPGRTTKELDDFAREKCREYGAKPILLGYHPEFAPKPYPAVSCISVNDTAQHGIPSHEEVLANGDVINFDCAIEYEGMIVDSGLTFILGKPRTERDAELVAVTRGALEAGIAMARPGNRIGDISHAIQTYVESRGFKLVEELCGHGVGYAVHEEPMVPNTGAAGRGPVIKVGHAYAIEPIVTAGKRHVLFDDDGDGYRVYTKDRSNAAHFEHTVVITEKGARILTTL